MGAASACRATCRRMSFIGSTDRTRGLTSTLLTGGGDCVNHSSVLTFHGLGLPSPCVTERTTVSMVIPTPVARMHEPTVEIRV